MDCVWKLLKHLKKVNSCSCHNALYFGCFCFFKFLFSLFLSFRQPWWHQTRRRRLWTWHQREPCHSKGDRGWELSPTWGCHYQGPQPGQIEEKVMEDGKELYCLFNPSKSHWKIYIKVFFAVPCLSRDFFSGKWAGVLSGYLK